MIKKPRKNIDIMTKKYISPKVKILKARIQPVMLVESPIIEPEPEFDIDTNLDGLGGFAGGGKSVWAD